MRHCSQFPGISLPLSHGRGSVRYGRGSVRSGCGAVLLALGVLAAGALQAQTLARAEALWKAHDYEGANNEFKALVAAQPKNADYRVRWGDLFYERFNPTEAQKLYEEAIELNPKAARAMLGIARIMA